MVPEGWKKVPAKDVCKSINVGVVIKPSEYYVPESEGVRAFRSANVREGFINDSDWVYFSEEGHKQNKKSELKAGDVLVVRSGYPGTACVVTPEFAGSNAIDIVIARPDREKIIPEYLCAFTNSEVGRGQILNLQGGMAQKHLNVGAYKTLELTIPPIQEQKKIAKILSTWDQAIAATEQLLTNSEQQKKALMQQLLTGKRRLPGFEGEWDETYLGELFSERKETGISDLPLLSVTSEYGIINRVDVGRKDTSSADKSKYLRVCPRDIAYNTMRMWQGVSALSGLEGIVSPAYTVLKPESGVDSLFAAYLFKLPRMIHRFYRHSQGLVSDTWNLKYKQFAKIKVVIPGMNEQKAIVEVVSKSDETIHCLKEQLAQFVQEKKALMQQLLTGKRRVKIDEAEHATA